MIDMDIPEDKTKDRDAQVQSLARHLEKIAFQLEGDLYYRLSDEDVTEYDMERYVQIRRLRETLIPFLSNSKD